MDSRLPGAADWVILGRGRWGCIELKSGCGRLSPSQKNLCSRVEKMGGRYCIARSLDEFEVHLRWILGLADGGISLRLNDASGMGELRIPENTSVEVSFGYKVSIPTGWVGEVTVAGLVGQRVLCGILAGDGVAELKVRLQTNNPYLPVFRAGEEIAQLHLRQMQPCTVQISTPFDSSLS